MNSNHLKNFTILLIFAGCFILYSVPASSQSSFDFKSETICGIFERDTVKQNDSLVMPIYEYLQFDFGNLEGDGLSFHFNSWGRIDSGDSGFYEDDPEGALLYAFLEYFNSSPNLKARLGRQKIVDGVTADSVEGIWISAVPIPWLGFSAYGGLPVALQSAEDRNEDFIWGARMFHRLAAYYEIGFSYKIITGDLGEDDERLGVDLFLSLPGRAFLSGFSSQNLVTGGWGEHSYEIAFYLNDLYVKPYYQHVSYEDFFNSGTISAMPFRFLSDTGEILDLYGSEVTWQFSGGWDISAKYNYYEYQIRDETASYFGGLLNGSVGNALLGAEIGLMDGKTAENRYMMTRTFFYRNRPLEQFNKVMYTGDILYVHYDEKIFNKKNSLYASLGAGRRFLQDKLELRFSGQYSSGPFYDLDLRAVVKVILKL